MCNVLGIDPLKYTAAGSPKDVKGKQVIDIMNGGLFISIFYSAINPTELCNYDVSHKVCDVLLNIMMLWMTKLIMWIFMYTNI